MRYYIVIWTQLASLLIWLFFIITEYWEHAGLDPKRAGGKERGSDPSNRNSVRCRQKTYRWCVEKTWNLPRAEPWPFTSPPADSSVYQSSDWCLSPTSTLSSVDSTGIDELRAIPLLNTPVEVSPPQTPFYTPSPPPAAPQHGRRVSRLPVLRTYHRNGKFFAEIITRNPIIV